MPTSQLTSLRCPLTAVALILASSLARAGDACEIKAYLGTGRYDVITSFDDPSFVIEVDPSTGKGTIYKPNMFGDKPAFGGEVGVAKRNASGDLELFIDPDGSSTFIEPQDPVAVIEVLASVRYRSVFVDADCTEKKERDPLALPDPLDPPISTKTEIFTLDHYGNKTSTPIGTAVLECK
jgi:hypothetical protein